MKNLNSLLARLSALSLAAAMFFSATEAATATTARKDPRAAAAVIEALVHKAVAENEETGRALTQCAKTDSFSNDVVVGTAAANKNLTVHGDARINGDVVAGAIAGSNATAGYKHLIGITSLDPRTQQLKLVFKDKSKASHGAFLDLEFVTTATADNLAGISKDNGVVTSVVRASNIYCHPQMTAQQIMGQVGGISQNLGSRMDMRASTTSWTVNAQNRATEVIDFRLTPTVRVEAITKDVCFGFVPYSRTYPAIDSNGYGFYEAGWLRKNYASGLPVFNTGTVAYQVASDCVSSVEVVSAVADELVPLDVFELFTDDELASLLTALESYFGSDSAKMRDYLVSHRHQLSRAFKALRA